MLNLDKEQRTYDAALTDMLKAGEGQYVVIRGEDICKIMPTYEDALRWGYETFGLQAFLEKQVSAVEPVAYFSRFAGLCAG